MVPLQCCWEGCSRHSKVTTVFSLLDQLPVPGDPAVVLGEVGARGVTGRAGRLCRAEQQRECPPPAVPVPCGQRGWCHHRSGGDHQVSAVGAVPGMEGSAQASFSTWGFSRLVWQRAPRCTWGCCCHPTTVLSPRSPGRPLSALSLGRRCFHRASGFLVHGVEL